jgi:replication factor C small subunit
LKLIINGVIIMSNLTIMDESVWIEKYRPNGLDDIVGHEPIIKILKRFIAKNNVTHLIFAGEQGVGKTATAIALAKDFYGEHWKSNFDELNASDERGISVVREFIKERAETGTYGNYPFRMIFLDEGDFLTSEAQAALRRTIERYSSNCRFIISCNYHSKLIKPIQSRCATFTFGRLTKGNLTVIINNICKNEGITIENDAIDYLIAHADGDSRPVINTIQILSYITDNIDVEILSEILKVPRTETVKDIIQMAITGDFIEAKNMFATEFIETGFDSYAMIRAIHSILTDLEIVNHNGGKEKLKQLSLQKCMTKLADFENRINNGNSPIIQFDALLAEIAFIANVPIQCTAIRS